MKAVLARETHAALVQCRPGRINRPASAGTTTRPGTGDGAPAVLTITAAEVRPAAGVIDQILEKYESQPKQWLPLKERFPAIRP
jgi:hypothetical protein